MFKKSIHTSIMIAAVSLLVLSSSKASAANYQLIRNDTTMTCIDTETGGAVKSKFITLKGYTYYFNDMGYAQTGWLKQGKDYYFFDSNGAMKKKQWVNQYFFQANGKMAVSKWINKTTYVGADGRVIPGYAKKAKPKFLTTAKGTRYRNYDGSFSKKTWQNIGKNWYYFYSTGYMAKNRQIGLFFVDNRGRMVTNKIVRIGKVKYYYGPDGQLVKTVKIKKKK